MALGNRGQSNSEYRAERNYLPMGFYDYLLNLGVACDVSRRKEFRVVDMYINNLIALESARRIYAGKNEHECYQLFNSELIRLRLTPAMLVDLETEYLKFMDHVTDFVSQVKSGSIHPASLVAKQIRAITKKKIDTVAEKHRKNMQKLENEGVISSKL